MHSKIENVHANMHQKMQRYACEYTLKGQEIREKKFKTCIKSIEHRALNKQPSVSIIEQSCNRNRGFVVGGNNKMHLSVSKREALPAIAQEMLQTRKNLF